MVWGLGCKILGVEFQGLGLKILGLEEWECKVWKLWAEGFRMSAWRFKFWACLIRV